MADRTVKVLLDESLVEWIDGTARRADRSRASYIRLVLERTRSATQGVGQDLEEPDPVVAKGSVVTRKGREFVEGRARETLSVAERLAAAHERDKANRKAGET